MSDNPIVNGIVTPVILNTSINWLGFTPAGVKLGSLATKWQSLTYGGYIPVDSIFSWLQSYGATNYLVTPEVIAISVLGAFSWKTISNCKEMRQKRYNESCSYPNYIGLFLHKG